MKIKLNSDHIKELLLGKIVSVNDAQIIASDDGVDVYQKKCDEALNQVRNNLVKKRRKQAPLKIDPKEVTEVRLSSSTMRDTVLIVEKRGSGFHNDYDQYTHKDFPDKDLFNIYLELKEAYRDTDIRFWISDTD